jgi:hypothetical protein
MDKTSKIANDLFNKGYLVMPVENKRMKYIKDKLESYKNGSYTRDKCKNLINDGYFNGSDLAICLNGEVCCIDIDNDKVTNPEDILNKLLEKFPIMKNFPREKTRNGYHIYGLDNKNLQRSIKCVKAEFLDIKFDYIEYETLSKEEQEKIKFADDDYILPIDYLCSFSNLTPGLCRCHGTKNIKLEKEFIATTQLNPFPQELLDNIINGKKENIHIDKIKCSKTDDACSVISDEDDEPINYNYSKEIVNMVKLSIPYLDKKRFINYDDFIKLTICLKNISIDLFDIYNKYNKLHYAGYDKKYTYDIFHNIANKSYERKLTLKTFIYWLKLDNPNNQEEIKKIWDFDKIRINNEITELIGELESEEYDIYDHYDKESGYMLPLPYDKNFMAVKSGLGSGKTYQIKKLIENYGKDKKILFIVGRQSLGLEIANNLLRDLKFTYYKDVNDFTTVKNLVIQIDSLGKLINKENGNLIYFDWIICDEIELLMSRVIEVNKNNQDSCFTYFEWCIKYANKIIFLDGQLSRHTTDIIEKARGEKLFKICNPYHKNKSITNKIYVDRDDKTFITDKIINDLKLKHKLYIVCSDKNMAESLKIRLLEEKFKVFAFTSQVDDNLKKNICSNLDEFSTNYDCFITTSVLLAGNSINSVHFHKVYLLSSNKSITPSEAHQIIRRVRTLIHDEIITCLYHVDIHEKYYKYVDIKNWMSSRNSFYYKNSVTQYNEYGIRQIKESFIFNLYTRYKFLQKNKSSFLSWYFLLSNINGYNSEICHFTDDINKMNNIDKDKYICSMSVLKSQMRDISNDVKINESNNIADAKLITSEEYENMKNKDNGIEDKYRMKKFIISNVFNISEDDDKETINNPEWILNNASTDKLLDQYRFLRDINYNVNDFDKFIEILEKNNTNNNFENLKEYEKYIIPLNKILKLLNYKNFADIHNFKSGTDLKKYYEINKKEILTLYNGLKYIKNCSKPSIKKELELSYFFKGLNSIISDLTGSSIKKIDKNIKYFENNNYSYNHNFQVKIPIKTINDDIYLLDD